MARGKLGLALGGGAARGWAHIGVLRVLLERGIVPDIIAGCSIGGVVGAAYLTDTLDVLESWARGTTKLRIASMLDFKMGHAGLIAGERLAKTLEEHWQDRRVEDLPSPFATVCTDMLTGHEVWLSQGRLTDAVRASFALPGVFPPFKWEDGRDLLDGALINPVPVSTCRALGAQMVIAVNINDDLPGRVRSPGTTYARAAGADLFQMIERQRNADRPGGLNHLLKRVFGEKTDGPSGVAARTEDPSVFGVMTASLGIVMDRIAKSRLAGDPPDIYLAPRIGHIGMAEFDRADELIELGRAVTQSQVTEILEAMNTFRIPQRHGPAGPSSPQ